MFWRKQRKISKKYGLSAARRAESGRNAVKNSDSEQENRKNFRMSKRNLEQRQKFLEAGKNTEKNTERTEKDPNPFGLGSE